VRKYGQISPRFWIGTTGKRIRALGAEAQVVATYLVTAPTSTMTGLYYLPIATAAHETGLPFEGARKALRSLTGVGFVHLDEEDEIVFVPEMARHQIADELKPGDNRIKGVVNALEPYRRHPFCLSFLEKYALVFCLPDGLYDGPPEPLRSPWRGPSEPLRSQEQEQEQIQEQEQEMSEPPARASSRPRPRREPSGDHQTFVARFTELFSAKNLGAPPSWDGKKPHGMVQTLLRKPGGLAEAMRRAENMFAAPPPWPPPPHDLGTLVQHYDRFARPHSNGTKVGHYQHTGDEEYAGGEVDL
jgi:hypothetical protein